MTTESQQCAIREMAYTKWEQAGWPQGDGVNFWLEAEQEICGQSACSSSCEIAQNDESFEASFPTTDEAEPIKISKSTVKQRKKAG